MASNTKETIFVFISDTQVTFLLQRILASMGYEVVACIDRSSAELALKESSPVLIVLSDEMAGSDLQYASELFRRMPAVPILLFVSKDSTDLLKRALRVGVSDYLCLPLKADDIMQSVQNCVEKSRFHREWVILEARRTTASLQSRMSSMETLARLGRSVTSSLDLDSVLSAVVDAAVMLTNAEEGSLLLLDESSGELYMRAARNFQEEFVRTFRLPVKDSLAGSVITSGQPVVIDEKAPKKIKTAYLVHSLIYVPIQIHGHVFGVLGVDNRRQNIPFRDADVSSLSAMAEYAVIAIENARLYAEAMQERNTMENILTRIQDGVIVIDTRQQLIMVNQVAQSAFTVTGQPVGKPFREVFHHPEFIELLEVTHEGMANRAELAVDDGRVFSVQVNPVAALGTIITLSDITYLKKLDRLKSDFVNTVSHDLRSPLTAIMGYVELIERAGPVTDMQREFIQRVQSGVHNITKLVDDLLNLGRIEAGFDTRKESVYLEKLIPFAVEPYTAVMEKKNLEFSQQLPETFPPIFANPVQLRQMMENLLDNAVKFTPEGGKITLRGRVEQNQIILQVQDTGIGIPPLELPYIFDRFYRASNSVEVGGTGLGLAMVKSIIENHTGRVWVDSVPNAGSTFTVVLPVSEAA